MRHDITTADLIMVKAAIDTAKGALTRALALLENGALVREPACCGCCDGQDFGDCPGCSEPDGRVFGGGSDGEDS